jgi:trans-2-enoyl-CoA reductase
MMELEKLKLPKGVELTDYQKFRQDFVKLFGRKPTEEEIWEAATHAARQPQKL